MQSLSVPMPEAKPPVSDPCANLKVPFEQRIGLRCPACSASLAAMAYEALSESHGAIKCPECRMTIDQREGIWLALPEKRQRYFEKFVRDYEAIRKAEGRGSENPEFYLTLPYRDSTRRNSWQWEIRGRTYRHIEQKILPGLAAQSSRPLEVLDLGAGNGWLSYRLAGLGHRPIAVDLCTNTLDGLGAAVHYRRALPTLFPRFRAELDRLPFQDEQFDCAVFNASFHYSESYDLTLGEASRCLRTGGTVVVADSPSYSREESGQQMLAERRIAFEQRFGFSSDNLASREYLTKERLLALEVKHRVEWRVHPVNYGFRWHAGR